MKVLHCLIIPIVLEPFGVADWCWGSYSAHQMTAKAQGTIPDDCAKYVY